MELQYWGLQVELAARVYLPLPEVRRVQSLPAVIRSDEDMKEMPRLRNGATGASGQRQRSRVPLAWSEQSIC